MNILFCVFSTPMKAKQLLLAFAGLLSIASVTAQSSGEPFEGGAQALGMANAAVGMQGAWSLFQNQAGLVGVDAFTAGAFYQMRFGMRELATAGFGAAKPISENAVMGLAYLQYGQSSYREQRVGLSYAQRLGERFDVGVQLDYVGVFLGGGYGSTAAFTFQGGFRYEASSKVVLAGHVYNPVRARLSEFNDERLPSVLRFGGVYTLSDKVRISAELRKHLEHPLSAAAGVEYEALKDFYIRTGFAGAPSRFSFGMGYRTGSFQFDIAASRHELLGFTPQIALTYHGRP